MDSMATQLRIREILKGGIPRAEDVPELRELAKKIYHQSALDDLILPLVGWVEWFSRHRLVFMVDDDKVERALNWVNTHPCKFRGKYQGAIGGAISYSFTDTTIGQIQTVSCACGEKHLISDDL